MEKINTLVLSSGGSKAVAFVGALNALNKNTEILKNIETYVGVSAGSFIALLLILGYEPEEMQKKIFDIDLANLKNTEFHKIFSLFGVDSGNGFVSWVQRLIVEKYGKDTHLITMKELYEKTGKKLIVAVTNLSRYKIEYLDYINSPDLIISTAVRMSISIPFFFTAVKYKDDIYLDGALLDAFPIVNYPVESTLGIYLKNNTPQDHENYKVEINNMESFAVNLCNCIFTNYDRIRIEQYYEKATITINCYEMSAMNFKLNGNDKLKLFTCGYLNTIDYLKKYEYLDDTYDSSHLEKIIIPELIKNLPKEAEAEQLKELID